MSKRPPGLQYNTKTKEWSIDKRINGKRVRQRLRSSNQKEAELEFFSILGCVGVTRVEGELTFREAALKFIAESTKRSLDRDIPSLKVLDPFIGDLMLSDIHMGTLQAFINERRTSGIKSGTVKR